MKVEYATYKRMANRYEKAYSDIKGDIKSSEKSLSGLEKGKNLSRENFAALVENLERSKRALSDLDKAIHKGSSDSKRGRQRSRERRRAMWGGWKELLFGRPALAERIVKSSKKIDDLLNRVNAAAKGHGFGNVRGPSYTDAVAGSKTPSDSRRVHFAEAGRPKSAADRAASLREEPGPSRSRIGFGQGV
jgi:hypothetical protein